MEKILIHFTPRQAAALRAESKNAYCTVSEVVRRAVKHYLRLPDEEVRVGRPFQQVKEASPVTSETVEES